MGEELKMENFKLKINSHSLSLRVGTRSLKFFFAFTNSLDVSHPFGVTEKFLIREAL